MDEEVIPDADELGRAFFELPDGVAAEDEFRFGYDKNRDECAESVYWRKYAVTVSDLHDRGCDIESKKRKRMQGQGTAIPTYIGARCLAAGDARAVTTERGFGINVIHLPEGGDRAHAHIAIKPPRGVAPRKIKTNDKIEIAACLLTKFGVLHEHSCS